MVAFAEEGERATPASVLGTLERCLPPATLFPARRPRERVNIYQALFQAHRPGTRVRSDRRPRCLRIQRRRRSRTDHQLPEAVVGGWGVAQGAIVPPVNADEAVRGIRRWA